MTTKIYLRVVWWTWFEQFLFFTSILVTIRFLYNSNCNSGHNRSFMFVKLTATRVWIRFQLFFRFYILCVFPLFFCFSELQKKCNTVQKCYAKFRICILNDPICCASEWSESVEIPMWIFSNKRKYCRSQWKCCY